MEDVLLFAQDNVVYAPLIIFGLFILAGLNLPIPEDALIFLTGVLAAQNSDQIIPLFGAVYLGAYSSDTIAYFLGRILGQHLWNISHFQKILPKQRVEKIQKFYHKNGLLTLVIGRFIPFGVRNALFITAGLSKMNFFKFALYDLVACTITTSLSLYLYYFYGASMIDYVRKGGVSLFICLLVVILILVLRKKIFKKQSFTQIDE